MAVDMFLKLGTIKGEATDPGHIGWIDVLAFSWGESNPGEPGGISGGKVNIQDVSLTKYIDKATVPILLDCAAGTLITDATWSRAGTRPRRTSSSPTRCRTSL